MQRDDLASLNGQLLWGTLATRRELAEQLSQSDVEPTLLALLTETVRSGETWMLRARCLEVLGLVAGQADRHLVERILGLLIDAPATNT